MKQSATAKARLGSGAPSVEARTALGDGNGGRWLFGIARNTLSHAPRHKAVATAARERLGMLAETAAVDPS